MPQIGFSTSTNKHPNYSTMMPKTHIVSINQESLAANMGTTCIEAVEDYPIVITNSLSNVQEVLEYFDDEKIMP